MKSVQPRDCALAIALPLTRDRFLGDLRQPERYDYAAYVRSLYLAGGAEDDYYWDVVYEPFARGMAVRCDYVERRGVTVVRDASLADLRQLLERFPAVTLVAHWRFRAIRAEDIVDREALLSILRDPETRLQEAYAREIERTRPGVIAGDPDTESVLAALTEILRDGHARYASNARDSVLLLDIPPQRFTRATLEQAFPGVVRAANSIELGDGMATLGALIEAIPREFDGVLDLTVCNSAILGEAIKAARVHCLVAVNRYPAEPHIRLARYRLAIDSIARRPAPFIDAINRFDV